jgi:hypothetical protein
MNHIAIVRRCESIVVANRAVEIKLQNQFLQRCQRMKLGMQSSWELDLAHTESARAAGAAAGHAQRAEDLLGFRRQRSGWVSPDARCRIDLQSSCQRFRGQALFDALRFPSCQ